MGPLSVYVSNKGGCPKSKRCREQKLREKHRANQKQSNKSERSNKPNATTNAGQRGEQNTTPAALSCVVPCVKEGGIQINEREAILRTRANEASEANLKRTKAKRSEPNQAKRADSKRRSGQKQPVPHRTHCQKDPICLKRTTTNSRLQPEC